MRSLSITICASFIGENLALDKQTTAGNWANLAGFNGDAHHAFVLSDMGKRALVLDQERPHVALNFAAEIHMVRSTHSPVDFIQPDILGCFNLLKRSGALANAQSGACRAWVSRQYDTQGVAA